MSTAPHKTEVGELRPSQVLTTFGVGSIIDLPNLSVMVMGLDDWPADAPDRDRRGAAALSVQEDLGSQVERLLTPPMAPESTSTMPAPFDERAFLGVPVAPFPRWLVCP